MREYLKFYVDGQWVDPLRPNVFDVEDPVTEKVSGKISLGSAADVDVAVKAARRAFAAWSQTTREQAISPRRSPRKSVRRPRWPRGRRSFSGSAT
jgi:aldehyde dehydrogenase (NAD+)